MRRQMIAGLTFILLSTGLSYGQDTAGTDGASQTKEYLFSMVGSNAIDRDLPFGVLVGRPFAARPDASFVKIHLFSDTPITEGLHSIKITSCGNPIHHAIAFINFDEDLAQSDEENTYSSDVDSSTLSLDVNWDKPVHSITLNFQDQTEICIQNIQLKSYATWDPIPVAVPKVIEGSVKASSTLPPASAYDAMNLFDSRFEYSWASNKEATGSTLEFTFAQPVSITALKIWNGYQRSKIHCQQNSRAKTLELSGDGYSAQVDLKDVMGSQVVALPKPFHGDHLTMKVVDAYRGSVYPDLVISELRFFDGQNWFLLNPLAHIQAVNKDHWASFDKAGLARALDARLAARDSARPANSDQGEPWDIRIRSDGSLYIQGYAEQGDTSLGYYLLGGYEILSATPDAVKLRVFGFLRRTKSDDMGGDCNGCGFKCNGGEEQEGVKESIVQQFITLKRPNDQGEVLITNDSPKRRLSFKKLLARIVAGKP